MAKKSKSGAGNIGNPPAHPSSKKPKKGVRHPGSPKGVTEANPMKEEKTAVRQARKSGQKTPMAIETTRKKHG
jgi:hypothetical protein